MRQRYEQYEPHVSDSRLCVKECLQRNGEHDCCPPTHYGSADPRAPGEDGQCDERSSDSRWEARRKIVLAKNTITYRLCPIGEGRFVETQLIIKARDDVITALNHLARCFGETRFVAVD